jgi:hypothetical protein
MHSPHRRQARFEPGDAPGTPRAAAGRTPGCARLDRKITLTQLTGQQDR